MMKLVMVSGSDLSDPRFGGGLCALASDVERCFTRTFPDGTVSRISPDRQASGPKAIPELLWRLKLAANGKGRIIVLGYADVFAVLALVYCALIGKPAYYIPAFHPWQSMRKKLFMRLWETFLFGPILRLAQKCLALSPTEYRLYVRRAGIRRAALLPAAIYSSSQGHMGSSLDEKSGRLLFVGRNDANKNLRGFIDWAEQRKHPKGPYKDIIVVSSANSVVPEGFQLEVAVPDDRLTELYATSDAICVPSRYESFSIAAFRVVCAKGVAYLAKTVRLLDWSTRYPTLLRALNDTNAIDKAAASRERLSLRQRFDMERCTFAVLRALDIA